MEVVVYKVFAWKIFYSKKKHLLSYNITSNFFLLVCRLISADALLFFPLNHVKFGNMANQVEHSKEQGGNQGQQKCLTKMQLMLEFFFMDHLHFAAQSPNKDSKRWPQAIKLANRRWSMDEIGHGEDGNPFYDDVHVSSAIRGRSEKW